MATKPCGKFSLAELGRVMDEKGKSVCAYPRMARKRQCGWHWLDEQPAQTQTEYANGRLVAWDTAHEARRDRVDKSEWPPGERWCAGCQTMVPLFYVSGSRCKACTSSAAHAGMLRRVYDISADEYGAMYALQGGRCYICQRMSPSRRLAVDHDHDTGRVRGLLCPDPERGCNHAILGPLEASPGGALAAAKRMVDYFLDPPYDRVRRAEAAPMATHEPPPPKVALPQHLTLPYVAYGSDIKHPEGVEKLDPPF